MTYLRIPLYWLFVTFIILAGTLLEHLPVSVIYAPTSGIIVFGPLPLLLVSQLGVAGAFRFTLRLMRAELSEGDDRLIGLLISSAFLFAGFGVVVGNIHVMRNLANPDAIGPGIAVSFVSLIYGILVPIYLLPFLGQEGVKTLVKKTAALAILVVPSVMGLAYFTLSVTKII